MSNKQEQLKKALQPLVDFFKEDYPELFALSCYGSPDQAPDLLDRAKSILNDLNYPDQTMIENLEGWVSTVDYDYLKQLEYDFGGLRAHRMVKNTLSTYGLGWDELDKALTYIYIELEKIEEYKSELESIIDDVEYELGSIEEREEEDREE